MRHVLSKHLEPQDRSSATAATAAVGAGSSLGRAPVVERQRVALIEREQRAPQADNNPSATNSEDEMADDEDELA